MILDCLSKAIFLYLIYNIVVLMIFGVPKSLSMTYYLFRERKHILKTLFPAIIIMLVIFLTPCWLTMSEGTTFQFTAFLSIAGLLFVGFSPGFMTSQLENKVHDYAAYLCVASSCAWIILVTQYWWIPIIWLVSFGIIAMITKTIKSSYIYWLENVAIFSTFTAMITYYEQYTKFLIN